MIFLFQELKTIKKFQTQTNIKTLQTNKLILKSHQPLPHTIEFSTFISFSNQMQSIFFFQSLAPQETTESTKIVTKTETA